VSLPGARNGVQILSSYTTGCDKFEHVLRKTAERSVDIGILVSAVVCGRRVMSSVKEAHSMIIELPDYVEQAKIGFAEGGKGI